MFSTASPFRYLPSNPFQTLQEWNARAAGVPQETVIDVSPGSAMRQSRHRSMERTCTSGKVTDDLFRWTVLSIA